MTSVLFLLLLVQGTRSVETAHPWGPVPPEWVFAEQEGIDSWPGIYHDRISGVCVHFDVAWPAVVAQLRHGTESLPAGYSGVPARLALTMNADCRSGRRLAAAFLPTGEGPQDLIWNAYADACNDGQLRRAKEFLLAPGAGPRKHPPNPDLGRLHTRAELQGVAEGTSYAAVRAQLGASSWAECNMDGGFVVSWTENSRPHYRTWEFTFNQAQQLIRKRRH